MELGAGIGCLAESTSGKSFVKRSTPLKINGRTVVPAVGVLAGWFVLTMPRHQAEVPKPVRVRGRFDA